MISELGGDAKIPDLWRMSALLEICPKDVKEQMMMMRLDEIGEKPRESQGESVVIHDQQVQATAKRTERYACAARCGLHEWQRTRRGGLRRCGRGSKGIGMLQLLDDGTLREGL